MQMMWSFITVIAAVAFAAVGFVAGWQEHKIRTEQRYRRELESATACLRRHYVRLYGFPVLKSMPGGKGDAA